MKNRLKELRQERDYGQKQFYDEVVVELLKINTTLRSYQNWERPENSIKAIPAQKLADFFGVRLEYLLGNSKIRTEEQAEKLAENISELNSSLANRSWEHKLGTIDELENQLLFYFRELPDTYKKFALKSVENIFILKEENDDKGGK